MNNPNFQKVIDQQVQAGLDIVNRKIKVAVKEASKRMMPEVADKMKLLFREAIDAFYLDYQPNIYRRRQSLYGILVFDNPSADYSHMGYSFERDNVSFSGGDSSDPHKLFEQTFLSGWHGGAAKGKDHPQPGVPYTRWPIGEWTHWHQPADIADEPPADCAWDKIAEWAKGDGSVRWKQIVLEEFAKQGLNNAR